MKNNFLLMAVMLFMHCAMAQNPTESHNFGPVDDSFVLSPDTLWFITGTDFMEGKPFDIINPHAYPIDVVKIDQTGAPCLTCVPWYTDPFYPTYPVTIQANSSITTLVKFLAIDNPTGPMVYDTLNVNTVGYFGHVILAADSNMVQIGMAEPGHLRMMASPNPFSEAVRISLSGANEGLIKLTVYDALMQQVRELYSDDMGFASLNLIWDGADRHGTQVSSGIYFLILKSNSGQKTLKIVKV